MDGFVEADAAFTEAGRGQHAEGAGDLGGLVGQDVAEHVAGDDDVEATRVPNQEHRAGVHQLVSELDVGIVRCDAVDDLQPQLRNLEDVGLVHMGQMFAANASGLETHPGDALDLVLVVNHRIARAHGIRVFVDAARFAEVETAGELPQDQHVDPLDHLRAQGGRGHQGREDRRRPQVREQAELLAHLEQAALRPLGYGQVVPARSAHRTEEDRLAFARVLENVVT